MSKDYRKQYSLDWLTADSDDQPAKTRSIVTESDEFKQAMFMYGRRIMDALEKSPTHEMRIHDIAKEVYSTIPDYSFTKLQAIIDGLENLRQIRRIDRDVTGNDLIALVQA
jgi:hypothetical protein